MGSAAEYVIVTVKLALPRFPAPSTAVQVTVVVPIGNKEPESGLQLVLREPLALSDTEAVNVTVIPELLGVETEMLDGTVTTGGVVSPVGVGSITMIVPFGQRVGSRKAVERF